MSNPKGTPANLKPRGEPGSGRPKGAKNKLTRERVEKELRFIAFSDPKALFDRTAKGKRTFTLREIHNMSEETRRCIASVKVRTENLTAGDDAQDTTVEIRLWEKTKALELCARALGMLKDVHVHEWDEGQLSRLDEWKRKNRKLEE